MIWTPASNIGGAMKIFLFGLFASSSFPSSGGASNLFVVTRMID